MPDSEQTDADSGVMEMTISLNINDHLGRCDQATIEDLVFEQAGRILADKLVRESSEWKPLRKMVQEQVTAKIEEEVAKALDAYLTTLRVQTDAWGNATGQPISLAQHIEKVVQDTVSGAGRGRDSNLVTKEISKLVEPVVKAEVKRMVDGQKDAIYARITTSVAEVLTEGIKRGVMQAERVI